MRNHSVSLSGAEPTQLDALLNGIVRRYRLTEIGPTSWPLDSAQPATTLALDIERAREASARGEAPDAACRLRFLHTLARLIGDAMHPDSGDPAFQAMVLRHRAACVGEYASLSAHAEQDRRRIRTDVAALAHPAKLDRAPAGVRRSLLARLHVAASAARPGELRVAVQALLDLPDIAADASLHEALARLQRGAPLERLERLQALEQDERVRRYRSLWDRQGPPPGSAEAAARGARSRARGASAETSAAQALGALARRLNQLDAGRAEYAVVTSMRVPATIPGSAARAKSEWDAVLLRRARPGAAASAWDVCLLVEAKSSVDAAATDFPRLLRGVRLLACADADVEYAFGTREGEVRLRGASLAALRTDEAALRRSILYCCDAPAEPAPRLLSAAGRMQLLTAPTSLSFAARLDEGFLAEPAELEPVWKELLSSPRWATVLNQYPMLRQVRELMVHPHDLLAVAGDAADRR
ncbi:3-deoxy-D-arabino-heptulosonate 7-phosphate synthase [Caballeronia sp. LZ034LL]|uniref:3-deoxy-D-arabino-heptulosonate 7-phosphate synthase n=1 Tax=Caballeronia sp. LZ034LL TaxID=3038567 RepID=UPI00285CF01F|nr:3-deoxy-D-arabino-heptulosonate 7-phosphate synthase [Caballeronia sp. LZ034LL]MDR5837870.1 3-deoxy-D-arabino-heptulosonate 7-phosphate synthase [Caballeronia sp. LZ034LL]